MKNRRNILRIIIFMLLISVIFTITASADVGNIFDDGDYSGGSGDGFLDSIFWLIFSVPQLGIPGIIIIIVIIYFVSKSRKNSRGAGSMWNSERPAAQINTYSSKYMPETQAIAKVKEKDPDFSVEEFKSYVQDTFIRVQEAWEAKKWEVVRPFESDALFETHRRQLEEYINGKKTNHIDSQCILGNVITYFGDDGKNEVIIVRLNVSLVDFITDDNTGNILAGSKTERRNRYYRLEFIRTSGVKTSAIHALKSNECPSCGAPISVSATGVCEYCKNVVTSGNYGWVLNGYSRWN